LDDDPNNAFAVTSTGTSLQPSVNYGDIHVTVHDPDGADDDSAPDNEPLSLTACTISRVTGANINCLPCTVANPDTGTNWTCNSNGLADANNNHTVTTTAAAKCGAVSQPLSEEWLADTTNDVVAVQPMTEPQGSETVDPNQPHAIVDHGGDPNSPNNDITDG